MKEFCSIWFKHAIHSFEEENQGKAIPLMLEIILVKPDYWWEIDHLWLPQLRCPEPLANKGDEEAASVIWFYQYVITMK